MDGELFLIPGVGSCARGARGWGLVGGAIRVWFCAGLLLLPAFLVRGQLRQEVLAGLSESLIVPAYLELAVACEQLDTVAVGLAGMPSAAEMEALRQAWVTAMLKARRVQFHRAGPLVENESDATFFYWQALKGRVEEVVASDRELNEACLEELGATAKGLFAVEYLLFDYPVAATANGGVEGLPPLLAVPHAARRREYLKVLTRDLRLQADALARTWQEQGADSPSARFVGGGQETLNLLVNELAMEAEALKQQLDLVLALRLPLAPQLGRIEGARSGTSVSGMRERLVAVAKVFGGTEPGLGEIVRPLNPGLVEKTGRQLTETLMLVGAMGRGLEEAVLTGRTSVERAQQAVHRLEILLKVDLASTLGVTITFSSNDGD